MRALWGVGKIKAPRHRRRVTSYSIECLTCGISTRHYDSYIKAVQAWNRRPDDILPEGLKAVYQHNKEPDDESGNRYAFVNRDL